MGSLVHVGMYIAVSWHRVWIPENTDWRAVRGKLNQITLHKGNVSQIENAKYLHTIA